MICSTTCVAGGQPPEVKQCAYKIRTVSAPVQKRLNCRAAADDATGHLVPCLDARRVRFRQIASRLNPWTSSAAVSRTIDQRLNDTTGMVMLTNQFAASARFWRC
jgi:hypothetical protein